ncbi:TatD DNase family protein [Thermotomaculum hydrothermale]|uniref:TatD DNase family protein n=1 Tax=Thermotomaculum hydrothermale TaxID=981385 RepID=A0A7R6PN06_9BACT|nr:TatD family hydrolase [Thermotomaculum hydrothermale]BBB33082.1 TatD DNase family protein [Thermotomaculum hydrothermale]
MEFIDSHCHLAMDSFNDDRNEVIERFFEEGGISLLSVSTNIDEFYLNKELCEKYSGIYTSLGWHPHDAKIFGKNEEDFLKNVAEKRLITAIGEIGLDFYYDNSPREEQIRAFEIQLKIAKKFNLPVIIHTRDADKETASILKKHKGIKGVIHCFTSGEDFFNTAVQLDFYISFSGIITFPKAEELRQLVKKTPIDRVFFETDSPYLSPVPYRGKRNEPLRVKYTIEKAAEIKGMNVENLSNIANQNFFNLFGKNSF